jgi:hypothetical protein
MRCPATPGSASAAAVVPLPRETRMDLVSTTWVDNHR